MALSFSKIIASIKYSFTYVILEDTIPYDNDDYGVCGIVFYNTHIHEVETAKYGHGSDWEGREDAVMYTPDLKNIYPMLDIEIRNALVDKWFSNKKYIGDVLMGSGDAELNIPCTVVNGRKAKGKAGYLLNVEERYSDYLASRYGSNYARNVADEIGFVYIPADNAVYEINTNYLNIDYDEAFAGAPESICENIVNNEDISTLLLAHLNAYAMSYSHIDSQNLTSSISRLIVSNYSVPELNIPSDVRYVDAEKREAKKIAKQQKLYEQKLPGIINWAKTVGHSTEEIKLIINRTMKKYNYLPVGVTEVDFSGIEI